MKTIGFIDYYIDEFHANKYLDLLRASSTLSGKFKISYAWEEISKDGLRPLDKWCSENNVEKARNIEEVIDKCNVLCILAPSNPETHERLSDLPLRSGKPVYIDKPFAPDKATAIRLFEKAAANNTPLMSSSALRFASEMIKIRNESFKGQKINFVETRGGGTFEEYSIHQIEMIVGLLGTGAKQVMQCGNTNVNHMAIRYADERCANMTIIPDQPFNLAIQGSENSLVTNLTDYFPNLLDAILEFYETKTPSVPKEETIEIISLMETGIKALQNPGEWINIL
jgi:predicted dehydrogenase